VPVSAELAALVPGAALARLTQEEGRATTAAPGPRDHRAAHVRLDGRADPV